MTMMRSALVLCVLFVLAGCMVGPDYKRPTLDLPQSAVESTLLDQQQEQALASWWTRYRDPTLDRLINQALTSNLDIAKQTAKIREARAELGYRTAQLFPSIEGQAQGMRQRAGKKVPTNKTGQTLRANEFSVSGSLNYELDFWGALRRADQQARAQLLSSAYTKDSIRLQTVADVVTSYMSLRALQRQIKVTHETIKNRAKELHLDQERYRYGAIDKLQLLQTRTLLDTARAQLPPLQENIAKLKTSLAILTGKTPRQIMSQLDIPEGSFKNLTLPKQLPKVLPSALVNRRPDIRAAEATLIAANANVGVAKANFFPTINLSAMIGTDALHIGDLFEPASKVAQIGGTITAPILEFGRIKSLYEGAKAQKKAAEISYRQVVRQAFKEVRDALSEVEYSQDRLDAVREQIHSYRQTVKLARQRYEVGRTDYFDVLDAERNLYSSQLDLADAIRDRFTATADLYKALGGGWTEDSNSLSPEMQATAQKFEPSQKDENQPGGGEGNASAAAKGNHT